MSLLPLFEALGNSPPGLFLKDSTAAFALTEAAHLVGLSLLGGIVATVGLSGSGILLSPNWAAAFAHALRPIFLVSLFVVLLSGIGLVAAGPYKYYTNPVFWVKLSLLGTALIGYALLDRKLTRQDVLTAIGWRIAAILVVLLWLAVAIAGRVIGLI